MGVYQRRASAISDAIVRAKKFLLVARKKDETWALNDRTYSFPAHYDTPAIKSAHACTTLITILSSLTPKETSLLRSSLQKELITPLPDDAPIDHFAFKLSLCAFSNAKYIEPIRKNAIATIMMQEHDGFWQSYSNTYHITNHLILTALLKNNLKPPQEFAKWAWSRLNKKGDGWGLSCDDDAQPSITAVNIFSLLLAGVPGDTPRIQGLVDKLELLQHSDGGWTASTVTDPDHSVLFSTALVLLVLLLTRPDEERESIKNGLDFILKNQKKDGSWPYSTHDKTARFFTMEYVLLLFSYLRFRNEAKSPQYSFLKERLSPCAYNIYLYSEYIRDQRTQFIESSITQLPMTRAFGNTEGAQRRRRDVLRVLSERGVMDDAAVIDALKESLPRRYDDLKKKTHLTLIKHDLSYLLSLGIIQKRGREHFIVATAPEIGNNV